MKNRKLFLYIISGILSAILLAYLLLNLDWEILRVAFADIHWGWLGLALLVYILNIFLRALRFANLIYSRPVKWQDLVPVSALHNISMYLMPAKTGDVTYIFIAKNRLDLPIIEGTATLLAARFYDFSVVSFLLAVLLPFSKNDMPDWIFDSSLIFCLLTLLGAIGILLSLQFSKPKSDEEQIAERTLLTRIRAAWEKFITGLREIQGHGAHGRVALLTAGIWLCVYSNFYFATRGMGLPVAFYHIAIISIVMIPLTLLPLQGFANIGTHEVGWTSVLVAFGYPYTTALTIAAGSHFVLLLSVLVGGGLAFWGAQIISGRVVPRVRRGTYRDRP
ncbi:MAG: flippase-like domain-containing protein [Chloroflexi bacterium]|nr:flippase-like domain-containing protein [Chloroflexota bacterium]